MLGIPKVSIYTSQKPQNLRKIFFFFMIMFKVEEDIPNNSYITIGL